MKVKVNKEFDPNITVAHYLVRNRLLNGLKEYIGNLNGDLLDFGCGSKPYKSLFTVKTYTGLDFESQGHDHSNEQIDVYYDVKTIPFSN